MYALFFMGPKQALVLDVLKAFFVFLVSGWTAGFLSLCGGLLSLLVMWLLYYHCPLRPTWFILSVCGALTHTSASCWEPVSSFPQQCPFTMHDYAGAGPCDGNAHQYHPAGHAACAGTAGL